MDMKLLSASKGLLTPSEVPHLHTIDPQDKG